MIHQTILNSDINQNHINHASKSFDKIVHNNEEGLLPVINHACDFSQVYDFAHQSQRFRESFKTVFILGTGGSGLSGKTLSDLAFGVHDGPKMRFVSNIDPHSIEHDLQHIDWSSTGVVAISKSGSTPETLSQFAVFIDHFRESHSEEKIKDHFLIISEDKFSPMVILANKFKMPKLQHHTEIGGRFAALSNVGLLPAAIAGLNPTMILEGASDFFKNSAFDMSVLGSAWCFQHYGNGIRQSVMMPYVDRLQSFCRWHRQIWAESLGKKGQGITPIAAFGTVDQHSQTQLYLDGPKNKMFTFLTADFKGTGRMLQPLIPEFEGCAMGDLMQAEQDATVMTIADSGNPARKIHVPEITEYNMGQLMMHFMLETMIMAQLMEINAFDQPAVEQGKILTRELLKQQA